MIGCCRVFLAGLGVASACADGDGSDVTGFLLSGFDGDVVGDLMSSFLFFLLCLLLNPLIRLENLNLGLLAFDVVVCYGVASSGVVLTFNSAELSAAINSRSGYSNFS